MNIEKLIADYRYKHPLAEQLGGEFIMQSDVAQIDAIQLVCDIFENVSLMQEPCEDCISRAEAQMEIEMNASRYTIAKECGGMGQVEWSDQLIKVSDAVDIIRNLPSVTPQKPKTEWILGGGYWRCSECKEKALLKFDKSKGGCKEYMPIKSNYCPNCGAKMVEPQESEERNEMSLSNESNS